MTKLFQQLITKQTPQLLELQNSLGYKFNKIALLLQALTHRSFTYEHPELPEKDN